MDKEKELTKYNFERDAEEILSRSKIVFTKRKEKAGSGYKMYRKIAHNVEIYELVGRVKDGIYEGRSESCNLVGLNTEEKCKQSILYSLKSGLSEYLFYKYKNGEYKLKTINKMDSSNYKIVHNQRKNGLEISFSSKPDDAILEQLKQWKFRWSKYAKIWYVRYSPEIEAKVKAFLAGEKAPYIDNVKGEPQKQVNTDSNVITLHKPIIRKVSKFFNALVKGVDDSKDIIFYQKYFGQFDNWEVEKKNLNKSEFIKIASQWQKAYLEFDEKSENRFHLYEAKQDRYNHPSNISFYVKNYKFKLAEQPEEKPAEEQPKEKSTSSPSFSEHIQKTIDKMNKRHEDNAKAIQAVAEKQKESDARFVVGEKVIYRDKDNPDIKEYIVSSVTKNIGKYDKKPYYIYDLESYQTDNKIKLSVIFEKDIDKYDEAIYRVFVIFKDENKKVEIDKLTERIANIIYNGYFDNLKEKENISILVLDKEQRNEYGKLTAWVTVKSYYEKPVSNLDENPKYWQIQIISEFEKLAESLKPYSKLEYLGEKLLRWNINLGAAGVILFLDFANGNYDSVYIHGDSHNNFKSITEFGEFSEFWAYVLGIGYVDDNIDLARKQQKIYEKLYKLAVGYKNKFMKGKNEIKKPENKIFEFSKRLEKTMPTHQKKIVKGSEEFNSVIEDLNKDVAEIPKLYAQDGKGKQAIVYLHYFYGGSDWYVTEYDGDSEFFGYVVLNGDYEMSEFGSISVEELVSDGRIELDFYWERKTLKEALNKYEESETEDEPEEQPAKTHTYQLGDKYRSDFDYEGMINMGFSAIPNWSVYDLQKLYDSFEDVNYHEGGKYLGNAIKAIKDGDSKQIVKKHFDNFHTALRTINNMPNPFEETKEYPTNKDKNTNESLVIGDIVKIDGIDGYMKIIFRQKDQQAVLYPYDMEKDRTDMSADFIKIDDDIVKKHGLIKYKKFSESEEGNIYYYGDNDKKQADADLLIAEAEIEIMEMELELKKSKEKQEPEKKQYDGKNVPDEVLKDYPELIKPPIKEITGLNYITVEDKKKMALKIAKEVMGKRIIVTIKDLNNYLDKIRENNLFEYAFYGDSPATQKHYVYLVAELNLSESGTENLEKKLESINKKVDEANDKLYQRTKIGRDRGHSAGALNRDIQNLGVQKDIIVAERNRIKNEIEKRTQTENNEEIKLNSDQQAIVDKLNEVIAVYKRNDEQDIQKQIDDLREITNSWQIKNIKDVLGYYQEKYFTEIVIDNPEKIKDYFSIVKQIAKKDRVPIYQYFEKNYQSWWDEKPFHNFVANLKTNFWNLIPDEYKYVNDKDIKEIKFEKSPDDANLVTIMSEFTANDDMRLTLATINFDEEGIVATDAHKLLYIDGKPKKQGLFCITKKCMKFSDKKDLSKDYQYPNYKAVIPYKNNHSYKINAISILTYINALLKAQIISDKDNLKAVVGFKFDYNEKTEDYNRYIAFNALFLKESIEAMLKLGHKELAILLSSRNRASLIVPYESIDKFDGYVNPPKTDFALIMPVIMTEDDKNAKYIYNWFYYDLLENKACTIFNENNIDCINVIPENKNIFNTGGQINIFK